MTRFMDKPAGNPATAVEKLAGRYHQRAVRYVHALRRPPFPCEKVHQLRTHLRRLQAYAEFSRRPSLAGALDQSVSWLSRLRTLDVFLRFLRRCGGGAADVRRVAWALREEETMIANAGRVPAIQNLLSRATVSRLRRPPGDVTVRLRSLGADRVRRLHAALGALPHRPKRKDLHRLRLLVKALRYQEEIALETSWGDAQAVAALKRLQRVLGDYCDRDEFRRTAKELHLACRGDMVRESRKYREKARSAVKKLGASAERSSGSR